MQEIEAYSAPRKSWAHRAVLEDRPRLRRDQASLCTSPAHTHLPISCLEGEEDLLPLLVGATPQAVNDGLLIRPWRKRGWENAGLGVMGMRSSWRLPGVDPPILLGTPTAPLHPSVHYHWGQAASTQ